MLSVLMLTTHPSREVYADRPLPGFVEPIQRFVPDTPLADAKVKAGAQSTHARQHDYTSLHLPSQSLFFNMLATREHCHGCPMPELNLGRSFALQQSEPAAIPVAKGVNDARWGERFTDLRSAANTYPVGMPARKGRNNRHHEHELLLKT
jgi:hypothetical protein